MRYRIYRFWDGGDLYYNARDLVGEAPTIDEAHAWIRERIKNASKVGLRLRPLDFDVVDSWDDVDRACVS